MYRLLSWFPCVHENGSFESTRDSKILSRSAIASLSLTISAITDRSVPARTMQDLAITGTSDQIPINHNVVHPQPRTERLIHDSQARVIQRLGARVVQIPSQVQVGEDADAELCVSSSGPPRLNVRIGCFRCQLNGLGLVLGQCCFEAAMTEWAVKRRVSAVRAERGHIASGWATSSSEPR